MGRPSVKKKEVDKEKIKKEKEILKRCLNAKAKTYRKNNGKTKAKYKTNDRRRNYGERSRSGTVNVVERIFI